MEGLGRRRHHHQQQCQCGRQYFSDAPTLDCLPPGGKGKILSVGGECTLRRRLLDMGLTPNTVVMIRKVAPLGDPIELYLRNYELTIRKEDARQIRIEEVSGE